MRTYIRCLLGGLLCFSLFGAYLLLTTREPSGTVQLRCSGGDTVALDGNTTNMKGLRSAFSARLAGLAKDQLVKVNITVTQATTPFAQIFPVLDVVLPTPGCSVRLGTESSDLKAFPVGGVGDQERITYWFKGEERTVSRTAVAGLWARNGSFAEQTAAPNLATACVLIDGETTIGEYLAAVEKCERAGREWYAHVSRRAITAEMIANRCWTGIVPDSVLKAAELPAKDQGPSAP